MDVECPYCSAIVDITSLERHVRHFEGDGHGDQGIVPVEGVDSPWHLRLESSTPPSDSTASEEVPTIEYVRNQSGRGRCPDCERGVLGMKGGSGLFSSGPRRLACPNCGWVSPDWLTVKD